MSGAGAGADPIGREPESALGPWASGAGAGAAQKSGGHCNNLYPHTVLLDNLHRDSDHAVILSNAFLIDTVQQKEN